MYYPLLLWLCSIGFLAAVPVVVAVRARQPHRMPWWLVVVLAAAMGWIASNAYAYAETRSIQFWREELFRQHILADFGRDADPSVAFSWGWLIGLEYLVICLGMYPLFRVDTRSPLIGLLTVAVALPVFGAIPPWADSYSPGAYEFAVVYVALLLCVAISYQILRRLRLEAAAYPFVVMFLIAFLLRQAIGLLSPYRAAGIRESSEWPALFGALFTAFWWIAIRKRPAAG